MLYESAHVTLASEYRIATLRLMGDPDGGLLLGRAALQELDSALRIVRRNPAIDVLVIRGHQAGSFGVGPDLGELAARPDFAEAVAISRLGQQVAARIAKLSQITVAYIHGPCLGGALELALACDVRVANGGAGTRLGFPQVPSGAIPCWGGTVRLPKMIGIAATLDLFLSGRKVSAAQARKLGLVDYAFPPSIAQAECDSLTIELQVDGRKPRPRRAWIDLFPGRRGRLMRWAQSEVQRKAHPDHRAPRELLRVLEAYLHGGEAEGLAAERSAMARLAPRLSTAPVAAGAGESQARDEPARPLHTVANLRIRHNEAKSRRESATEKPVQRIGIIGGGTIGVALAQWASIRGCTVAIQEYDERSVLHSRELLAKQFRRAIIRRLVPAEELADRLASIPVSCDWIGFETADLVIEAVNEDRTLKTEVLQLAERRIPATTLIATTTTSLTVRELQNCLTRPQRMLGMHVGHPAASMKWAEVTAGPTTHPTAVIRLRTWLRGLGKRPLLVADRPGRVLGRVLLPYLHEAVLLAEEGFDIAAVDEAVKRFGLAWGPFETLDQMGLDVALVTLSSMTESVPQVSPPPLLEQLVNAGCRGAKNDIGFYRYGRIACMPNTTMLPKASAGRDPDLAVRRSIARLLIACHSVIGSGLIRNAEDLDGLMLGAGWPAFRGGPMRYAQQRGLPSLVKVCDDLARRYGPRFEPGKELRRRAGQAVTMPVERRAMAA